MKHRTGPRNRPIRYQVDVCYVLKGVLKEQYDKFTVTADRTGVTISIFWPFGNFGLEDFRSGLEKT